MNLKQIGSRIAKERERLNIKSAEVCSKLDIHSNTLANYEKGKRDMPSSNLIKLWNMGFDVMYILFGVRITNEQLEFSKEISNEKLERLSMLTIIQQNLKNEDQRAIIQKQIDAVFKTLRKPA